MTEIDIPIDEDAGKRPVLNETTQKPKEKLLDTSKKDPAERVIDIPLPGEEPRKPVVSTVTKEQKNPVAEKEAVNA